MKILLNLIFVLTCLSAQAASVRIYFQNRFTLANDTNYVLVTAVDTNVLAGGGVSGRGVTKRYTPPANGFITNTLAVGHYALENPTLGTKVLIRVPDTSAFYDYTNLLISGFNTFVTIEPTFSGITNALGYVPATNGVSSGTNASAVTAAQLATASTNGAGVVTISVSPNSVVAAHNGTATNLNISGPVSFGGFTEISKQGTNMVVAAGDGDLVLNTAGTTIGNASGLTNASPALATNNATATDGQVLVKRGDRLKLETVSGSGNQTNISYTGVTNFSAGLTANAAQIGAIVETNLFDQTSSDVPHVVIDVNGASDIEDFGKMALAAYDHVHGQIVIEAVLVGGGGSNGVYAGEAIRSILDYQGAKDIPIGVYTNSLFGTYGYDTPAGVGTFLANRVVTNASLAFGFNIATNYQFDNYANVFRRTFAKAQTNSLVLLLNEPAIPITNALMSPPDSISPLTGLELYARAGKSANIMAGDYTNSMSPASLSGEYNIQVNPPAFTNMLAMLRSTGKPRRFIGFSLGSPPTSGMPGLMVFPQGWHTVRPDSPIYNLSTLATTSGNIGRAAWGTINLLTVELNNNTYSTNLFTWATTGSNVIVTATGSNWWQQGVSTGESYLSSVNTNEVQRLIRYRTERYIPTEITFTGTNKGGIFQSGPGATSMVSYGLTNAYATGMYFPSTTTAALVANGTECLRVDNGNVVIPSFSGDHGLVSASFANGGTIDAGLFHTATPGEWEVNCGIKGVRGSLQASNVVTTNFTVLGTTTLLGTTTAQNIAQPTNTWAINTAFGLGTNSYYTGGAQTLGVTGIANNPAAGIYYGELEFKPTGDIIFTNPVSFKTSDYAITRTFTNGNSVIVAVRVKPGVSTNLSFVQFR